MTVVIVVVVEVEVVVVVLVVDRAVDGFNVVVIVVPKLMFIMMQYYTFRVLNFTIRISIFYSDLESIKTNLFTLLLMCPHSQNLGGG